jgi:HNH endonuclease
MRKRHDWPSIQQHYDSGLEPNECRRRFGITYSAWAMAIRRGYLRVAGVGKDQRRRYDWRLVQSYYDQGHSFYDCMSLFGFCRGAWHKAVRRGEIKPRPLGQPIDALLANGRSRRNIKVRLLRANLLENRCSKCGVAEWMGKPLAIQIDHINGRDDHRLANLRMLCPNCHSQTETCGTRIRLRGRLHEAAGPV